ncbi:hypothetical protein HID58_054731, partial [Brassica napus]
HKATALSQIVDSVAALSCEVTKGDITSFSSLGSGDGFGNKDAISIALWESLRSKRFPKIPRLHGKFRDVVRSLHSDARVELNSGGKTGSGNSGI